MNTHALNTNHLAALIAAFILQSAIASAAFGAYPVCQYAASDTDGNGWGWENNGSCRITAQTQTTTTTSRYPSCSSTIIDHDNDGWGWENSQTCKFDVTTVPTDPVDTDTTTTNNQSTYPSCTSTTADNDGDGWGHENGQSCLVTVTTQTGGGSTTTVTNNSGYPDCSSSAVDPDNDGWGYENNSSCIVIPTTGAATGITPPGGNHPSIDVGEIFKQTFTGDTVGLYQGDQLNSGWNSPLWHLGFDQGRVKIVSDPDAQKGKVMEVTYPAGAYGASGASAFLSDIRFGMDLPESYNELYVSYDIKFDNNFEFVLGGKLPGLCGYNSNQLPSTGCNTGGGFPDGYDGWSARGMWRAGGALENYVYHANQSNYYGDDEHWNVNAIPGTWHRIQHRVVLNTVGSKNGILEAWFDNTKVLTENTLEYRKVDTIGINLFYFSTFFGGNNSSWAPSTNQRVFFDNFTISTRKIP